MVLYGCCDFLWATDRPAFRLGAVLQQRGLESGVLALTSYSALSARNLQKKRKNYKVRPKWYLNSTCLCEPFLFKFVGGYCPYDKNIGVHCCKTS